MHGHFFETIEIIHTLSAEHRIPYTIRSHSYDVADERFVSRLAEYAAMSDSELCLGILAFPYVRERLERAGFSPRKIVDTGPVFWHERFFNPLPREKTGRMLAMGSAWPKKNFEALIDLAPSLTNLEIDIYAAGGLLSELQRYNERQEAPVRFVPHVCFQEMPETYRRYDWYIYSGNSDSCGLPISILEAQASGIGVLHRYTRPDDHAFLNGGGFIYRELEDVIDIVKDDYPEDMRERGYINARLWDIKRHIGDVASLWHDHLRGGGQRPGLFDRVFRKGPLFSGLKNIWSTDIATYVIHLSRDYDRHIHVCETLLPKLENGEVIDAFDGLKVDAKIAAEAMDVSVDYERYRDYSSVKLSCSLSHMKACRRFLESRAGFCVILEDDVDVPDDFAARLRDVLEAAPQGFDVIYLDVHPQYKDELRAAGGGSNCAVVRYAPPWNRSAYLVSRSGAERLVKGFRKIGNHGDIHMSNLAARGELEVYCVSEPITRNLGQLYIDYRGERFPSNLHCLT